MYLLCMFLLILLGASTTSAATPQNSVNLFDFIGLSSDANNDMVAVGEGFAANASLNPSFSIPLPYGTPSLPSFQNTNGAYDSYTASYVYSFYERGTTLFIIDTIAGASQSVPIPCSPTCNIIYNIEAYNGIVYGIAGMWNIYYNFSASTSVYFFTVNILTLEVNNTFWYSIPSPLYYQKTAMGVAVLNNKPTIYAYLTSQWGDGPGTIGWFTAVDVLSKSVYIQKHNTSYCGDRMFFDYSKNVFWCVNSNGLAEVQISKDPEFISTTHVFSTVPPYYLSRCCAATVDVENQIFYTLASNDNWALNLVVYNITANTSSHILNSTMGPNLWFLNVIGTPAPCYGCAGGTCDQVNKKCNCLPGWTGPHCGIRGVAPPQNINASEQKTINTIAIF